MNGKILSASRARQILAAAQKTRVLVVGDVMLDQFIWGGVSRISPEAPVPVVEFSRESFMPGGAANVARNLVSLQTPTELFGAIGNDDAARKLLKLLGEQNIGCTGLVKNSARHTSVKTRIVAHQQQVVRIDRETRGALDPGTTAKLLTEFKTKLAGADAVIVGDYGKGVERATCFTVNTHDLLLVCHDARLDARVPRGIFYEAGAADILFAQKFQQFARGIVIADGAEQLNGRLETDQI